MFTKKKNPGASYLPGFKYKKEGGELCQAQLMWAWTLIESDILFVFVKTPTPTQHNGWVWQYNDCANHPTPTETFQALLDKLKDQSD